MAGTVSVTGSQGQREDSRTFAGTSWRETLLHQSSGCWAHIRPLVRTGCSDGPEESQPRAWRVFGASPGPQLQRPRLPVLRTPCTSGGLGGFLSLVTSVLAVSMEMSRPFRLFVPAVLLDPQTSHMALRGHGPNPGCYPPSMEPASGAGMGQGEERLLEPPAGTH